jgi:outer membrane lipoprotein-sorting protein
VKGVTEMKKIMDATLLWLFVLLVISCATVKQAEEPVRVAASPTEVSAESGNGRVTITWNGVAGAESYSIYMSGSEGTSKKNFDGRRSTTATSYTWAGLTNGTSYYFVLTAVKKDGESSDSKEVTATPKALKEPPKAAEPAAKPKEAPKVAEPAPKAPEVVAKPPREAPKAPEPAPKVPEVTAKPPKEAPKAPEPAPKAVQPAPKPPEAAPKVGKLTPEELLIKADEIRAPGQNFVQDVRVTLKKGNTEAASNRLVTRVKGYTKSLAIFKEPPTQKDQVLLMLDNNMWMYFPKSRQPIRISPAQQLLGNVSNADVARVVYNVDYKAESVEEDTGGTDKLLKLTLKAKTEGAAYGSIKLWMNKESTKLSKAEFYTLAGRLLKTTYYKGYKQLLGRERPTLLEIHDAVKKDEITTLEYLSMKIEDTPDNYFQRSFMDRASQL